ncbi:MAG TPA: carbon-nitrogen hydrolase family protein [Opitutaceae bacterium]|jgi:predicted amidohydrolase
MRTLPLFAAAGLLLAASGRADESGAGRVDLRALAKDGTPLPSWSTWAPRDEIRPKCFVDSLHYRTEPGSLAISGNANAAEYGGWSRIVPGIRPGQYYRLVAYYRCQDVADERREIVARMDWLDAAGHRTAQPDYAYETLRDGAWTRVTMSVPAPAQAAAVKVELSLAWSAQGSVWWDDIALETAAPPPPRWVRVATICVHPNGEGDTLGEYIRGVDAVAKDKPDIVCLGEEMLLAGSSKPYLSVAEEIPGPSTRRLGEVARKYHTYLVAGLTEREGHAAYNTAVLIDRQGNVAGKYHKVYLPREEVEGGLTPGVGCPVFKTDFGTVGLMICWDAEYTDPARAMGVEGAEILFVPAAGGYMTLLRARALENHLYIVSCGDTVESAIINPVGDVLFATKEPGVNKVIPVNLAERFIDPWLGDMRPRFHKELRWDIATPGLRTGAQAGPSMRAELLLQ